MATPYTYVTPMEHQYSMHSSPIDLCACLKSYMCATLGTVTHSGSDSSSYTKTGGAEHQAGSRLLQKDTEGSNGPNGK